MQTSAILFPKPHEVAIVEFDLPVSLEMNEVLVRTLISGVSSGTETRVLAGLQPDAQFPLIPGYENVGQVIEIGSGVRDFQKIGDIIFHSGSQQTGPYQRAWGASDGACSDHRRFSVENSGWFILGRCYLHKGCRHRSTWYLACKREGW